jgi:hypothetical protein
LKSITYHGNECKFITIDGFEQALSPNHTGLFALLSLSGISRQVHCPIATQPGELYTQSGLSWVLLDVTQNSPVTARICFHSQFGGASCGPLSTSTSSGLGFVLPPSTVPQSGTTTSLTVNFPPTLTLLKWYQAVWDVSVPIIIFNP